MTVAKTLLAGQSVEFVDNIDSSEVVVVVVKPKFAEFGEAFVGSSCGKPLPCGSDAVGDVCLDCSYDFCDDGVLVGGSVMSKSYAASLTIEARDC